MMKCIRKSLQTNSYKTFHFYREVTIYLLRHKPKVCCLKRLLENSLVVHWLGLCAFTAENPGSIPDWGTKIPQMVGCGQSKKKQKICHGYEPYALVQQDSIYWGCVSLQFPVFFFTTTLA